MAFRSPWRSESTHRCCVAASLRRFLRHREQYSSHSCETARHHRQLEVLINPFQSAVDRLPDAPHRLTPAKALLDGVPPAQPCYVVLRELALHLKTNFSEVAIRLLVAKCFNDVIQGKAFVDDRVHPVGVDGSDHVLLMGAISYRHPLKPQLFAESRNEREISAKAGKDADQRNVAADSGRGH